LSSRWMKTMQVVSWVACGDGATGRMLPRWRSMGQKRRYWVPPTSGAVNWFPDVCWVLSRSGNPVLNTH